MRHLLYNLTFGLLLLSGFCLLTASCGSAGDSNYHYFKPDYTKENIHAVGDTIVFPLEADVLNKIEAISYFVDNGVEYISFFDKRSQSINVYNFRTRSLYKKIALNECIKNYKLKRPSAYLKNFDSLYVINFLSLLLIDRHCKVINQINLEKDPATFSSFKNSTPPILKNGYLYASASPYLRTDKKNDLNKWNVMYEFDLNNKIAKTKFGLPDVYKENDLGVLFFRSSYCLNGNGNFVFSFPADTNIYETNLADYSASYSGKSKFQIENIQNSMSDDNDEDGSQKKYLLRNSYGSIYYDAYHSRYLRVAEEKLSDKDYQERNWRKKHSVIILNDQLKIIGESVIDRDIDLSAIIFTNDGSIYARTNNKDEKSICLVKLEYGDANVINSK